MCTRASWGAQKRGHFKPPISSMGLTPRPGGVSREHGRVAGSEQGGMGAWCVPRPLPVSAC